MLGQFTAFHAPAPGATPAKYSALSARAIPRQGGDTEFADMRAAYDALPDADKALEVLKQELGIK